jgi:1-phosphatidylinositol-4-phosphate 5-kinase
LCSSGKSGSLFYYTEDGKYMLKTISRTEFKKFKVILKNYNEHLKTYPKSLVLRFYGLHKIKIMRSRKKPMKKKYIAIMRNIF